jgi:hypothetical protein
MEKHQFHIEIVSHEDKSRVEQVLDTASSQFELVDTTVTSRVPLTIRCYSEKSGAGFGLGARIAGDLIVVDFNALEGHTNSFLVVMRSITSELQQMFGNRMQAATKDNYIKANHTLPESPEAREFNRRMFAKLHGNNS